MISLPDVIKDTAGVGAGGTILAPSSDSGSSVSDASDQVNESSFDLWGYLTKMFAGANPLSGTSMSNALIANASKESISSIINKVGSGEINALEAQQQIATNPNYDKFLTSEQKDYLINMLEQFNAQQQYDRSIQSEYDTAMAQARAAQDLGMNSSAYVAGQQAGATVDKAGASHDNTVQNRINRQTQLAKTFLGLIGGMASAGIYGGSMANARKAVAKLTTDASLTATKANNYTKLLMRRKGQSTYDRKGNFLYHTDYDY